MNLKKLKEEMKDQPETIRVGSKKASVRGDYTKENRLEFWKKKNGQIEIKWSSRIPVKSADRKRCDLGHLHEFERSETWIWDYAVLSADDVEKLREFFV